MIDTDARAETDDAIARSLARVRRRASGLGGDMEALGAAIERAAGGGKRFRPALVVAYPYLPVYYPYLPVARARKSGAAERGLRPPRRPRSSGTTRPCASRKV